MIDSYIHSQTLLCFSDNLTLVSFLKSSADFINIVVWGKMGGKQRKGKGRGEGQDYGTMKMGE